MDGHALTKARQTGRNKAVEYQVKKLDCPMDRPTCKLYACFIFKMVKILPHIQKVIPKKIIIPPEH